ncbi:MAG: hypothetical protein HFG28_15345 [Eubacterium sp.]|nr:hypothetical protein [Eubacterium sp.]
MKCIVTADGRVNLIRTNTALLERQETCHFSDGGSVYYQVFSDGVVYTGYFDSKGRWFFVPPGQVNSFFNLSGDSELDSRPVTVDGHDACVLKGVWSHLCDC